MELGVSFKGDYLLQGSKEDKLNQSKKYGINNIELYLKDNGKDMNLGTLKNYKNNVIVHIPIHSNYENNMFFIKNLVPLLVSNNINTIIVNASNISSESLEWSTDEEKSNHVNNICDVLSYIANNGIKVLIENTSDGIYGSSISDISDILVISRNMLIDKYRFNSDQAKESINICLSINNNMDNLEEWNNVFKDDIKVVKIQKELYNNTIVDFINNTETLLLLEYKDDLESLKKEYISFKNTLKGSNKIVEKNEDNGGFTNIIVLTIILFTAICAVLMVLVKIKG